MRFSFLALFVLLHASPGECFLDLSGIIPNEYKRGQSIEVRAVKLASSKTQIPYKYYDLDFCRPDHVAHYDAENFGEILRGDRPVNTRYDIKMGVGVGCAVLCKKEQLSQQSVTAFSEFIFEDYSIHLTMDQLLGASLYRLDGTKGGRYNHGVRIGIVVDDVPYIYNHLKFKLQYNTVDNDQHRLVGFEVEPYSISESNFKFEGNTCELTKGPISLKNWKAMKGDVSSLYFTYEVSWEPSDIRWASRWDVFLKSQGEQIHWFSIVNSIVIVMFLTSVISMILIRTLRKDIAKYNRDEDLEDILEESGWKLVHGDVFRPPRRPRLLTALIGSGVQIHCMVSIIIFFAMLGMLSPTSRGTLMSAAIFTYVFMGLFAGYYAGRLYKTLRGALWKSTAVATGILFPMLVLSVGSVVNSCLWYRGSSAALPFSTILAMLSLWLCISLPLVYVGFFFGFRKRAYEMPVRTNQIPRAVPPPKFHQNLFVSTMLSGALPFGAVFIEVFFVYLAVWESRFYYFFGFLFAVFIILIICCSQVAIVLTYFQLCNEDYRWWWHTFIASGGPAVYLFIYSVFYYWTNLRITQFLPTVIYFGYTMIMVMAFWILTGTIGFVATFVFLRYIYSAIKID